MKIGKIDTFNQELMLRIMSEEDRLIPDCDIQWYKFASLRENLHRYNIYITTDFAVSEKAASDPSVISVWAYSSSGDWFWIDGIAKRQKMSANIDDLFRLAQKYRPLSVGIEVSGQQEGFIPWIQDQMLVRKIMFPLASQGNNNKPGIRPTTDKMARFMIVEPWFKAKQMWWPREKKEEPVLMLGMNELRLLAKGGWKSKTDDFSDTISMLALLDTFRPSEEAAMKLTGEHDIWELDDDDEDNVMDSYTV